jgi:hypothetical protein
MSIAKKPSTAETLRDWTGGDTLAERMASAILRLENYSAIDPQHPLGGPDGGKDILCYKNGKRFVTAVYFPYGDKTFATIRRKFKNDLKGALKASVDGMVFLTNQGLSQKQRQDLNSIALGEELLCEPIHRERIRVHLDSTAGYGARLQFLGIEMAPEEQFAYFTENDRHVERLLEKQTREIARLARLIESLSFGQREIFHSMALLQPNPGTEGRAEIAVPDLLRADAEAEAISSEMTVGLLLTMHRLACPELPSEALGHLRTVAVQVASLVAGAGAEKLPDPPEPGQVAQLLRSHFREWNRSYDALSIANEPEKLAAIARFHAELLRIHPFIDGNGRVGRAILVQQCIDLLGQADDRLFDNGVVYQRAVREAMLGKPADLSKLIERIVHG